MKNKKLFIFDIDGTLVDSYKAIERSLNFTRKKFKRPPVSSLKVKRSVGEGDRPFVETFFPKEEVERALATYRRHHEKALLRHARLYPRARKVLSLLRRRKKIVAVASNRPAYFADILLRKLDIKKYFHAVYCGDELKSYKPKPKILQVILKRFGINKADAVYIGDMAIDIETAKRAKVEAVFKKGGSSSLNEVSRYKDKRVIGDLEDIFKIYN
jgi:HAD superfamily hydrolase (TIGR01549 family)